MEGQSNGRSQIARGPYHVVACLALALVAGVVPMQAMAATPTPGSLLAIDQNRAAVVDKIVAERGPALIESGAGLTSDQLRAMLMQLRADQLLAAGMAGTLDGVRDVLARSLVGSEPINPALLQPVSATSVRGTIAKAIGDGGDDVVYTPVTPCRLVETRGTFAAVYQGDGTPSHTADPFSVNEVRTYTVQGGNSVCLTQLPGSLDPVAVQLQVFGMPTTGASGDIEILPQGATFGSTATEVFIGSIAFNTVSTTVKINTDNNQISVKVTGGKANLAMDVVGYFKVPGSYGGTQTITGVDATVSGGFTQIASGDYSSIGGGLYNSATGAGSVVAGGDSNIAAGIDSVVSGGWGNVATGFRSTVSGGLTNTASGDFSTIPGGLSNQAIGNNSFAAGHFANATSQGEFVWSDRSTDTAFDPSSATDLQSPVWDDPSNTFNVRATGGVWFVTAIDATTKQPSVGVYLPHGSGSWTLNSDRAVKENFHVVDDDDVLRKIDAMPVTSWNYIAEGAAVRHVGPMAQDFRAAFGLGSSDRGIATVDESGIALAAIKALSASNAALMARIRALEDQVTSLQRRDP
jgi:Chaperone of endosialidase